MKEWRVKIADELEFELLGNDPDSEGEGDLESTVDFLETRSIGEGSYGKVFRFFKMLFPKSLFYF